ncbi:MAG: relaxase/mobilization nuclease domain-containing protein [Rhodobacteraceae bacterium]|nr:relaxase/mobilization nuclease domain-containing protein [Paracoccaceae bacterium]
MRNTMALYEAVMGNLWENQQVRGKTYGRIDVRISGRRQGRSYSKTGRASVRNVAKAASGQSRAAIFKRIRSGGCKTRTSLGNQLAYVNDKAVFTYASMGNALDADAVLTEDQKSEIIEDWAETWQGTTKLGFTSHMLLSFPKDVSVDQVRDITMEWASHFFESGDYGDQWDYVLAVHDDRAHKHAHILLNNRGVDQGTWFSCWAEGVMSPQLMREKQAEIAEKHGIVLDATTRLERGIFAKPAGMEEIYAAKSEARLPREIARTAQEHAMAEAQVTAFAKEYKSMADLLDRMDQSALASSVRGMAKAMGRGEQWQGQMKGELNMRDIQTVGQATEYAERAIEAIGLKIEELEVTERAAFEIKTTPLIKDLSKMVPDPELQTRFNRELVQPFPTGSGNDDILEAIKSGNDQTFDRLLAYGKEVGLDTDDILARMEAGGTQNYGLAQNWVERDMNAVLAPDGLNVDTATEVQRLAALETVDTFMDGLGDRVRELTGEMRLGQGLGDPGNSDELSLIDDGDVPQRKSNLQGLADILTKGGLSAEDEEVITRDLKAELARTLPSPIMRATAIRVLS